MNSWRYSRGMMDGHAYSCQGNTAILHLNISVSRQNVTVEKNAAHTVIVTGALMMG
ncbi:hypothetical protein ACVST5_12265 [Yersinia enterocolitica]|uniref:hypothetical protein n=1 Tax=Yersinia enterocolitica TaxID=630 RepID=UPI001C8ED737|nr:hypothetical protein [Yersinia enterocolitica]MBX9476930.1 hypothetical protein [Yersinia enterocolitica]MBX9487248.1 hypothetical protein [Yersinia enterocolitica]HEN3629300.1 hypothetical protein [Yersinia enterocolitica]